ncbi:MAG TPA: DUF4239 domain-containing protein [Isosphaeraceae bacterium]|nr:DUF4239 domain-containing protein [Isosphaeraceae bacterium]
MTMYWIYDIPTWALATLLVVVFNALSLGGLYGTRPLARRVLRGSTENNDLVSYFVAAVGVFYGLALGLIAVATWQNFTDVDGLVSKEAASLAALYRDLDGYPQPLRGQFEQRLRDYTKFIIDHDWPAHQQGRTPEDSAVLLDDLQDSILAYEPTKESEKIAHSEALKSLDNVMEQRRLRLQAVSTGLPASLWIVVVVGALLNIVLTNCFWVENLTIHAILVSILATFIALLIFLTAAMDNPFRGEFSVSSDAYQTVLENVMKPQSSQ